MKHRLSEEKRFALGLSAFFVVLAMFIVNIAVKIQPYIKPYSYSAGDTPRTVAHQTHSVSEWAEGFGPPEEADIAAFSDESAESAEPAESPEADEPPPAAEPPQTTASGAPNAVSQPQEQPAPQERAGLQSTIAIIFNKRPDGPLNINTAALADLMELDGIGKTKGKAIIAYREEHGAFASVDELLNVSGIGEKTLDMIRDYITV